jgi:hypothetical protein
VGAALGAGASLGEPTGVSFRPCAVASLRFAVPHRLPLGSKRDGIFSPGDINRKFLISSNGSAAAALALDVLEKGVYHIDNNGVISHGFFSPSCIISDHVASK